MSLDTMFTFLLLLLVVVVAVAQGGAACIMVTNRRTRRELGGTRAGSNGGFVAALKAYRQLDGDWVEYSPRTAADVLELAPEDYEVDEEHSALLLRRLPPGLPESARDIL